jgi:glyoxylase-like metal-dependent hydrolase (beta-lactamase superfamily II)/ferredoxin
MALPERRLAENVGDDFYVDSTCIDCDACRQIAPATFRDAGDQSVVYAQPQTEEETLAALKALVACPTASIGVMKKHDMRKGIDAFPSPVDENIYFCGFTSESSFGAWSYLIVRPQSEGGNILVDSPRYATQLVKKIEALGGVSRMFLTHRDDVADHERFAKKFKMERIMHERDGAVRYNVERVIDGDAPVQLDEELTIIPVPGHTRGHMVLLYRDKYLFTGDHLAWSPARSTLTAFRSACWYSWTEQVRSMEKLRPYSFEWVLPGHGRMHEDTAARMSLHLERCIEWMRQVA